MSAFHCAQYDARFVTVGPLVFFSTQTGDAWIITILGYPTAKIAQSG
jgi:hypothetical protein